MGNAMDTCQHEQIDHWQTSHARPILSWACFKCDMRFVPMDAAMEKAVQRHRRALHEIAEEWAGAECGEPVTAQEAYAIALAKRMYRLAVEALSMADDSAKPIRR